jgi:hypothetical protein
MSIPTDTSARGRLTLTFTPMCQRRITMKSYSRIVSCVFANHID